MTKLKNFPLYMIILMLLSCSENNSKDSSNRDVNLESKKGYTSTLDSISIQNGTVVFGDFQYSEDGKTIGFSMTSDSNKTYDYSIHHNSGQYQLWQKDGASKTLALEMQHKNGWLMNGHLIDNRYNSTTDIVFEYTAPEQYNFKWIDSSGGTSDVTEVYVSCDDKGKPKLARWADYNTELQVYFTFADIPNPYFRRIEILLADEIMENFQSVMLKPHKTTNYNGQQIPVSKAIFVRMPWLSVIAYNSPNLITSFTVKNQNEIIWFKNYNYQIDSLENKVISFGIDNWLDTTSFYFSKYSH